MMSVCVAALSTRRAVRFSVSSALLAYDSPSKMNFRGSIPAGCIINVCGARYCFQQYISLLLICMELENVHLKAQYCSIK